MNCEKCAEELTSLVFDELSDDAALSMHEHLAECEVCRETYMELIDTQSSLESALTDNVPVPGLREEQKKEILGILNPEIQQEKKSPIVFPSWLFAVAACLVIGLIVFKNNKPASETDMAKNEEVSESAVKSREKAALADRKSEFKDKSMLSNLKEDKSLSEPSKTQNSVTVKGESKDDLEEASPKAPIIKAKKSARRELKPELKAEEKSLEKMADQLDNVNAFAEKKEAVVEEVRSLDAGAVSQGSVKEVLEFSSFTKMLEVYSRQKDLDEEVGETVEKLKAFKKEQLQFSFVTDKTAKNSAEQKFLVRILDNAKKAIDYAHIFVHNQKIIRVERVR